MSGNPFRKQPPTQDSTQDTETQAQQVKIKGKVKKVQFVSPVASPHEPPSHPRFPSLEELDEGPKSPPPEGLTDTPDHVDIAALLRGDLTAGGAIDLKANEQLEAASAASTPISPNVPPGFELAQPPPGRRGPPPPNPFARTLANMDGKSIGEDEKDGTEKGKPSMDVDAFKRLLLTGKADAPQAYGDRQAKEKHVSDTDTSPAAGQQKQPDVAETLRSTRSDSSVSSTEGSSIDRDGPRNEATKDEANTSAAASQQDHTSASPQPFASQAALDGFGNLEPSNTERHQTSELAPFMQTRLKEPNAGLGMDQPAVSEDVTPPERNQPRKSGPPAPPVSRRQGHVKTPSRARSSSNASQAEITSTTKEIGPSDLIDRFKPLPPQAPPSRGAGKDLKRPSNLQDSSTASTESVPTPSTLEPPPVVVKTKLKPPPPPSRHVSKQSEQGLQRTPSSSSSIGNSRVSSGSAPPPPPPRRSESKRLSYDGSTSVVNTEANDSRRCSGHSPATERRDSVSSLQRVAETATSAATTVAGAATSAPTKGNSETDQSNALGMLADLDAFQKEVDALREKALASK